MAKGRCGQRWPTEGRQHGHAAVRSRALRGQEEILILSVCLTRPWSQQNTECMAMGTQTAEGRMAHPKQGVRKSKAGGKPGPGRGWCSAFCCTREPDTT